MKKTYKIPFDKKGDLCYYPDSWRVAQWLDNWEFKATVTVIGYSRGNSAANFDVADEAGNSYTVFLTDMLEMLKHPDFNAGVLTATFTFCKRGQNYGLKLAIP